MSSSSSTHIHSLAQNPQAGAELIVRLGMLIDNARSQVQSAHEMQLLVTRERLRILLGADAEQVDYDLRRLLASMRALGSAGKDPFSILSETVASGKLDFPFSAGGDSSRAHPALRRACQAFLDEMAPALSARPAWKEQISLDASIPAPSSPGPRRSPL